MLSADDLSYIAPYESRLFLNDDLEKFIEKSKNSLVKAKRRRRLILLSIGSVIIVVLTGITIWAFRERAIAYEQRVIAKNKELEAEIANQEKTRLEKLLARGNVSIVIAPAKMNILYVGVENPIYIAVEGLSSDKIDISISSGLLRKIKDGYYIITPGNVNDIDISVYGNFENKKVNLGSQNYRVKKLPKPQAYVNGKVGGNITTEDFLSSEGISAGSPLDFDWLIECKILSFTIGINNGKSFQEIQSNSALLSENQKSIISKIKSNSKLFIYNIKASSPDGNIWNLNSLYFNVIDIHKTLDSLIANNDITDYLNIIKDNGNVLSIEDIVTYYKKILINNIISKNQKTEISKNCSNLSYKMILGNNFNKALELAILAKETDPDNKILYTNLAASYLLNNDWNNAKFIYKKYKYDTFNNISFKSAFLEDIITFESKGIKHPDFEKVKKLLNEK